MRDTSNTSFQRKSKIPKMKHSFRQNKNWITRDFYSINMCHLITFYHQLLFKHYFMSFVFLFCFNFSTLFTCSWFNGLILLALVYALGCVFCFYQAFLYCMRTCVALMPISVLVFVFLFIYLKYSFYFTLFFLQIFVVFIYHPLI